MTLNLEGVNIIEKLLAIQATVKESVLVWTGDDGSFNWVFAKEVPDEFVSSADWLVNSEGIQELK